MLCLCNENWSILCVPYFCYKLIINTSRTSVASTPASFPLTSQHALRDRSILLTKKKTGWRETTAGWDRLLQAGFDPVPVCSHPGNSSPALLELKASCVGFISCYGRATDRGWLLRSRLMLTDVNEAKGPEYNCVTTTTCSSNDGL